MTIKEPLVVEIAPLIPAAWPTVTTWRYLGDRGAADLAYCERFGTKEAPEPSMVPGGLLAYGLPATEPVR